MVIKKILLYFLCVSVLFSCFSLTVYADNALPVKYPVYNLMDNTYFYAYGDEKKIGDTQFDTSYYFENVNQIRWTWPTDFNSYISSIVVIIEARRKPDHLYLSPFETSLMEYGDAEYLGEIRPGYFMYRESGFNNGALFNLTATYNDKFSGSLNVVSAYGLSQVSEEIEYVDFTMQNCIIDFDGLHYDMVSNRTDSFPFYQSSVRNVTDETDFWNHSQAYIRINSSQFKSKMAESVSILVGFIPGVLESADQPYGCTLLDSDGSVVAVLPVTAESASGHSTHIFGDFQYKAQYYLVSADLSGYDLSDLSIQFEFTFDNMDYGQFGGIQKVSKIEALGCYILPLKEENNSFWAKVLYFLTNIGTSIKDGFAVIGNYFNSLLDKLDTFFSGGAAGEALSDAGSSMSEQAGVMNEAQTQLDSVDRPSLDPNSLFGDYLNFDTGGLRVLSVITSNKYVTPVMVVVFTFALCGYVFFGKRK